MEQLSNKTDADLERSILAEVAKAANELRCAEQDVKKAQNRLSFVIVVANELINRSQGDQK